MKKRMLSVLLAGLLTAGITAGCSAGGNAEARANSNIISVITKDESAEYWREVQAGAVQAGEELGYDVRVYGADEETDVQGENTLIMEAQKESAALVIAPSDPNSLLVSIADLHRAGMPIVLVDSVIPDETAYDAFIGTDNLSAGKLLGKTIAKKNPNAVVGIIRGQVDSETHDLRSKGLQDALQSGGCTIVAIEAADSLQGKAEEITERMLREFPELDTIVATNDPMALGAVSAAKHAKRSLDIYGFDASTVGLDALLDGKLAGCGAQDPIEMGYQSVMLAEKLIRGEEVEKQSSTDYVVLNGTQAQARLDRISDVMRETGFD